MAQHIDEPKRLRRIEVITGGERRRRWSSAEKARIVAESFAPGAVVAEVARRYELSAQHLTGWRRQAREGRLRLPEEQTFAPVLIAQASLDPRTEPRSAKLLASVAVDAASPVIEMEAGGVHVRARESVSAALLEAIVRALRAPT